MKWQYLHPKGVTRGGIVPGSIEQLTPEEVDQRLLLRVPDEWTGTGVLRDRRTGEVLLSRKASQGLTEREAPAAPRDYARESDGPSAPGPRFSLVWLCGGIVLASAALLLYYRRRRS